VRIAYVSSARLPGPTAHSIAVMKTAEALALEGHEVALFGVTGDEHEDMFAFYGVRDVFDVVRWPAMPRRGLAGLRHGRRVAREVARRGPFDLAFGREANALGFVGRGTATPMILELHGPPRGRAGDARFRYLLGRKSLLGILPQSEQLRSHYVERYPRYPVARVGVLYHGADPASETRSQPVGWPGRPGRLQAGYVGSIDANHGADVVSEVARRLPDVDVHLIGKGPKAEVARLSSAANVFAHGFVRPADLSSQLSGLDCYLVPQRQSLMIDGRWEWPTMPSKIFSGMANGLAICASDIPVVREIITDDESGSLVGTDDIAAWVASVDSLRDPDRRGRLGSAAKTEFERRFTWRHRARRIVEFAAERSG
jgi:glycosyltransferase involved in cell wall biosynthesis